MSVHDDVRNHTEKRGPFDNYANLILTNLILAEASLSINALFHQKSKLTNTKIHIFQKRCFNA